MVESSITDVESQAAQGDRSAQISMARTLLDAGQTEAGRNWLRRAAESGPPDIKLALGEQLIANPPYEVAEALHWTHAAAEEGSAEAAHRLAVFAAEGIGEPQSWSDALIHLKRAATLGHRIAQAGCSPAVMRMEPAGFSRSSLSAASSNSISSKRGPTVRSRRSPASVGATLRVVRVSSRSPSRVSRPRTVWLSAD